MAQEILIIGVCIGGCIGWSLFFYTFIKIWHNRKIELIIIKDISIEIKAVKKDIDELKKTIDK